MKNSLELKHHGDDSDTCVNDSYGDGFGEGMAMALAMVMVTVTGADL